MKLHISLVLVLGLIPFVLMASNTPKIFITRPDIPKSALDLLKAYEVEIWNKEENIPREIFLQKVVGVDALFIHGSNIIDAEVLNAAGPKLKVISTISAGYDHIDVKEAAKREIKVGYTPGVLNDAVADIAVGLMLVITRRMGEAHNAILTNKWKSWSPWNWMNGFGVKKSKIGIFGLGNIGLQVAKRLVPFKPAKIFYTSRSPKPEANEFKGEHVSLDDLLRRSDIVFVTVALTPETKNIINAEKLDLMKNTSYIINVSRGLVIDQDALVKALKEKKIAGAALDVMTPEPLPKNHELTKLSNCFLLPHIGSADVLVRQAMAELCSQNILAALTDSTLPSEVIS